MAFAFVTFCVGDPCLAFHMPCRRWPMDAFAPIRFEVFSFPLFSGPMPRFKGEIRSTIHPLLSLTLTEITSRSESYTNRRVESRATVKNAEDRLELSCLHLCTPSLLDQISD